MKTLINLFGRKSQNSLDSFENKLSAQNMSKIFGGDGGTYIGGWDLGAIPPDKR
jgi:hypothetical protein